MIGRPSPEQVNAFVDGELGLAEQLELERLVREDPPLQAQVDGLRALRRAVREEGDYHRAPDALRARVRALARRADAAVATPARAGWRGASVVQRWFAWRPLAASSVAVALVAVLLSATLLQTSHDEHVMQDVIASHVRATLAQHLVDVRSSDHHTVKPWLSSKLDFSPPVRELSGERSALLGARVDYVDERPVAVLVYQRGAHLVDAYVWPTQASDTAVSMSTKRGFQLARWNRDGMAHWVVSDLNPQEFKLLVHELGERDKP